jgi:hypothetical protein
MKRILFLLIMLASCILINAQAPAILNYQGVARNAVGNVLSSKAITLRLTIRDGSATGNAVYSETRAVTTNPFGLFNVQIGSTGATEQTGTISNINWGAGSKFVNVEIDPAGGNSFVQVGVTQLASVPYALSAGSAAPGGVAAGDLTGTYPNPSIRDAAVTTSKIADNNITAAKVAPGELIKSINGLKDGIIINATGGAAINTTGNTITISSPDGDITGITTGAGLIGGGTAGNLTLAASFSGSGLTNLVARSDHNHIGQTWTAATGRVLTMNVNDVNGDGLVVSSTITNFDAAGIKSTVWPAGSESVGIFGNTLSTNGNSAAVWGQTSSTGAAKGVWGYAGGANTYGIFGSAAAANSWAGFFQGRVHVGGTLSKAAGSFRIDHPLDPANKILSHSFVESPDMMNVYNGNVKLDARGEATVKLPDYFEALNRDFRYQLTAIGAPSPNLYISQEVAGNTFRIAGGSPNGKVSWNVTGIRQDEYAKAFPILVEEEKTGAERGTYINPLTNKDKPRLRKDIAEAVVE